MSVKEQSWLAKEVEKNFNQYHGAKTWEDVAYFLGAKGGANMSLDIEIQDGELRVSIEVS